MKARRPTHNIETLLAAFGLAFTAAAAPATNGQNWTQRLEADWLLAEKVAAQDSVTERVTTKSDAAGGCDGIKNGEFGFHTGATNDPWWQVDLGAAHKLGRVVIWNRRAAAAQAARIKVLLSDDGRQFRPVYQHDGTVFGGVGDDKPLVVDLKGQPGRFVRLAVPGKNRLHLDEVEVFAAADAQKNIALHQPADQCSVSQWSVAHSPPREVDWTTRTGQTLAV